MDRPEEHLIQAATPDGRESVTPTASDNPFRPPKPSDLSIGGGIAIGAGSFFLLGMTLVIYFAIGLGFSLDLLKIPLTSAFLGGIIGGLIGLVSWVASQFRQSAPPIRNPFEDH